MVQAHEDALYAFDSWTSLNTATGLVKKVTTNLYEDVANADYQVRGREGGREGGRARGGEHAIGMEGAAG